MPVPRRDQRWIWAGRIIAVLVLAGVVGYLARVGLDTADKLASSIGVVIALAPGPTTPPGSAAGSGSTGTAHRPAPWTPTRSTRPRPPPAATG
jgi:hypothetical protein